MATNGIFVGLSTIDMIYTVNEFPAGNRKAVAQSQEVLVGGPATNAAITFAFLGGSAILVSPVGRHAIASLIRDECRRYGIELIDLTPKSNEIPPISSVWVNRDGQRSVVSVNTTRAAIPSPEVDPSILAGARVLMVDGHAMDAGQAWSQAAKSAGIPVVFDGGSWKAGTDRLLRNVDTAICSADFLPPGCKDEDQIIGYLRASGVKDIAITRGPDPVRFVSSSSEGAIVVPRVDAVDTTGAGDIFHGAFCFHTAEGHGLKDALGEAAKIASDSCRFHGTRKWMTQLPDQSLT